MLLIQHNNYTPSLWCTLGNVLTFIDPKTKQITTSNYTYPKL